MDLGKVNLKIMNLLDQAHSNLLGIPSPASKININNILFKIIEYKYNC